MKTDEDLNDKRRKGCFSSLPYWATGETSLVENYFKIVVDVVYCQIYSCFVITIYIIVVQRRDVGVEKKIRCTRISLHYLYADNPKISSIFIYRKLSFIRVTVSFPIWLIIRKRKKEELPIKYVITINFTHYAQVTRVNTNDAGDCSNYTFFL